jgi:choline dehydrogenase-like flavoprotein
MARALDRGHVDGVDAIVVGSGFAGAWAAKELAEAGVHTLMLEAGPARTAREIPKRPSGRLHPVGSPVTVDTEDGPDRNLDGAGPGNRDVGERKQARQHVQREHPGYRSRGPHLFIDDADHPYQTPHDKPYYWIRGMQVGGRSLTWGGTALRLSPYELDAAPLDGCPLAWPLRYETLAPAYTAVEELMGLCGSNDGLPQLPDGCFLYTPHDATPAEKDFQKAYRQPGTHPIPVRFIPSEVGHDGWPRFTMQGTALAAAERTRRLQLRANAVVTEVTTDPETGWATGVRYVDTTDESRHLAKARVVFLCCGTVETARLMLNSRGPRHPDGLGNSTGWVGRGLMDHPVLTASGVLDTYLPTTGYEWSARQSGLIVPPVPGCRGNVRPFGIWVTLQRVTTCGLPVGMMAAQGEMLPYRHNRVRLGETLDQWGVPIPVIECAYGPHEQRLYTAMRRAIEYAATVARLRLTRMSDTLIAPGLNVHDLGTVRMGSGPRESVLDADNRCWTCPNVFVTDGACFPGGGWQNPTLTIMALSARAGRFAATLLDQGAL